MPAIKTVLVDNVARLGRAPRQALVFDGTGGATISNLPAFGTGDFTVAIWYRAENTAANHRWISGPVNSFGFLSDTTAGFQITKTGVTGSSVIGAGMIQPGKLGFVAYVRSGTAGTFYHNGAALGSVTDSNDYSAASTTLGQAGDGSLKFPGMLSPLIFNRALSSTEMITLYEQGQPAAADFNSASNTASYTSDFSAGSDTWTALNTALTGNIDTIGGQNDNLRIALSGGNTYHGASKTLSQVLAGRRVRVSMDVYNPSASAAITSIRMQNVTTGIASTATKDAWVTLSGEFVAGDGIPIRVFANDGNALNADGEVFYVRNVRVWLLGLLLAPDPNEAGIGYQWHDLSGNRADLVLGVTGITWAIPNGTANYVRGSLSWSGTHEQKAIFGGGRVFPTGAATTLITTKASAASAGTGIAIGHTGDSQHWVANSAFNTSKKVQTLNNRFGNNASDAQHALYVDPDSVNYTGTIEVQANYTLTQGSL